MLRVIPSTLGRETLSSDLENELAEYLLIIDRNYLVYH